MAAYNFEIAEDVHNAAEAGRGGTYQCADIGEANLNMFFATIDLFLSAIDFVLAAKNALELVDTIHVRGGDLGLDGAEDVVYNFNGPAKRHFFNNINQKTLTKSMNTVIDPSVNISDDVLAINKGLAQNVNGNFLINGRMYGMHNGTLYPISGEGFYQLNRGAFNALGVFNQFGDTDFTYKILGNMKNVTSADISTAFTLWSKLK